MIKKSKPCRTCRRLRVRLALAILASGLLLGAAYFASPARAAGIDQPAVELLIRGSDDFKSQYPYVSWAPAPSLIRVLPQAGRSAGAQLTVVLTNESAPHSWPGPRQFRAQRRSL